MQYHPAEPKGDLPVTSRRLALAALAILAATSATLAQTTPPAPQMHRMGPWGFDLTGMDTSIKPGDDFTAYVSGGWLKTATIPADRSSYGAFVELREGSEKAVRAILEGLSQAEPAGSDRAKLTSLLKSFMNTAEIEKRDAAPLQPVLASIKAIKDKAEFITWLGKAQSSYGINLFGAGISADAKNPDYYTLGMRQSGLGLPDRDYYLTEKFAKQKAAYQAYIVKMLGMSGWEGDPEKAAADIVAFETKIAEAHWTRAQSRDRDKTYNAMTPDELAAFAPGFDFKSFLAAASLDKSPKIIVGQKSAFPKLAEIFAATDLETLKAWEAYHVTDEASPLLSQRFVDANFEFKGKFLTGQPQIRDRIKRGVGFVEGSMGEAVGREYVAQYFPPESKAKMEALVADITAALHNRIQHLEWMTPATKEKALAKLGKFHVKIGYPVKWRDYTALEVAPDDLIGNALRSRKFQYAYELSKLGQKVDKDEWGMTPQTVNAYYSSTQNEIVFPAAILQPPFFDPDADPAINYGGIGGVIGHEITHGFDDQGRKSDGDGVLTDWWSLEDSQKFEVQAFKLGTQYESYQFKTLPNSRIIAKLTMGENIADLGGALLGLDAYHTFLARTLGAGKEAPVLDGFTGDQRVFLGWTQVWRSLARDAALQQQLQTDSHSPGTIRSYAPLRNVDAWYKAFNVQPGDKLYLAPEDRVHIW